MKISKTIVFPLLITVVVGVFAYIAIIVMNKSYSRIIIQVPDDFRGFIRVVENQVEGVKPNLDSEGRLWMRVPDSGILELKNMSVFFRPFEAKVLYNSELLRVAPISDNFDGTVLWVLNQPMAREMYFYLGNRDEAIEFFHNNRRTLYTIDIE